MTSLILTLVTTILMLYIPSIRAATIQVTALPGLFGCDLVEAVSSANGDTSIGGCTAGTAGLDTITFSSSFTSYELEDMVYSHPSTGSSATPVITSEIKVIGPNAEPLVIERGSGADSIRLFVVDSAGVLNLENLSLRDWRQSSGMGFSGGTELTLDYVEIVDGQADFGGAVWVQSGDATIRNSLIRGNTAGQGGGGIGVSSHSSVAIFDSTITNNHAISGGGVSLAAAPESSLAMFNVTITENSADGSGGGVALFFGSGTSTGNSATIRNSIISGNTALTRNEMDLLSQENAELMEFHNNVIGTSEHTFAESVNSLYFLINDNLALSSNLQSTPLRSIIGSLADNGGKLMTHALVANSPAIDNGLPYSITGGPFVFFTIPGCRGETATVLIPGDYRPDQRGVARPIGGECDIGAYEYEPDDFCFVTRAENGAVFPICL